jgi:putative protease
MLSIKEVFFSHIAKVKANNINSILSYLFLLVNAKSMETQIQVPELLAPAGNLDKLKLAVSYGANAVYLGGMKFGLRSAADNFTDTELKEGVEFAHSHNALVYVVLNGFLHDSDLAQMVDFIHYLDELKVDAVIVSDLGVIKTVIENSSLEVHLSTQASCLNVMSAKLWKKMGVTRVVVGREVSIAEAKLIKEQAGIEVEMFIHGSMCMAYSGNCVISNFTQGRDSNRGGCAHSCRFDYSIEFDQIDLEKKHHFFMSSKDLNGLVYLEEYIKAGIDSVKVEGRMKSHLYASTISKVYSEALKFYKEHGHFLSDQLREWDSELKKFTHRSYAPTNLLEKAGSETIFDEREHTKDGSYVMVGRVIETVPNEAVIIEVRNAFNQGDQIEFMPFHGNVINHKTDIIKNIHGELISRTKPTTLVKLPYIENVHVNNVIRMQS